ncbi:glyoxalase [Lujinxingia litoralis]|uniref:Glyoxalase n=1 Tax=Lujinxingia litoralis TaxID=2211119 RepID=A0A328CB34_9DELT|nr:VOC family protein [Lujinxingia litoralis]RAL25238.1 glyoxalase [Lujinxingia litoralis]
MTPRLHHIALGARDVASLADFYQRAFALPEITQHHYPDGRLRSVWLDLNPGILMVEHTTRTRERAEGVDAGPFLLAFTIDAGQRDAMAARLVQLGASLETQSDFSIYARDPEGNRVALSHYPPPRCS